MTHQDVLLTRRDVLFVREAHNILDPILRAAYI